MPKILALPPGLPDRMWSRQETAEFLGVPVQTISVWRLSGRGPRASKVGRYLRYNPADVMAWLEQQKDPA